MLERKFLVNCYDTPRRVAVEIRHKGEYGPLTELVALEVLRRYPEHGICRKLEIYEDEVFFVRLERAPNWEQVTARPSGPTVQRLPIAGACLAVDIDLVTVKKTGRRLWLELLAKTALTAVARNYSPNLEAAIIETLGRYEQQIDFLNAAGEALTRELSGRIGIAAQKLEDAKALTQKAQIENYELLDLVGHFKAERQEIAERVLTLRALLTKEPELRYGVDLIEQFIKMVLGVESEDFAKVVSVAKKRQREQQRRERKKKQKIEAPTRPTPVPPAATGKPTTKDSSKDDKRQRKPTVSSVPSARPRKGGAVQNEFTVRTGLSSKVVRTTPPRQGPPGLVVSRKKK